MIQIISKAIQWLHVFTPTSILSRFPNTLLDYYGIGSNIPQFILDIEHPWIAENRLGLAKIDAKDALCNDTSLLRSDVAALPPDLFTRININTNRYGRSKSAWKHVDSILRELSECPLALQYCQHVYVDIYIDTGIEDEYGHAQKSHVPPDNVVISMASVLESMPNLTSIEWIRPSDHVLEAKKFEEIFSENKVSLPGVEDLKIGPNVEFLISSASALRNLSISGGWVWRSGLHAEELKMIEAAKAVNTITNLRMKSNWTPQLVETIASSMPQLEILGIEGRLAPTSTTVLGIFQDLLLSLDKLPNLKTLHLPYASELELGFDGGAWCGNAYFMLSGTHYGRSVLREEIWAVETAARLVVEYLPRLNNLCIWARCTTLGETEKGGQLIFPWTGRIGEFLLEEWPRFEKDQDGYEDSDDNVDEDVNGPIFATWEMDEMMLAEDWRPYYDDEASMPAMADELDLRLDGELA